MSLEGSIKENTDELIYEATETTSGKKRRLYHIPIRKRRIKRTSLKTDLPLTLKSAQLILKF